MSTETGGKFNKNFTIFHKHQILWINGYINTSGSVTTKGGRVCPKWEIRALPPLYYKLTGFACFFPRGARRRFGL